MGLIVAIVALETKLILASFLMKETSGLLLIIVLIPAMLALGHDVYLFFMANDVNMPDMHTITKLYHEDRPGRGFKFASLGYIWTRYSPDTFRAAADSFTQEEWEGIRRFLSFKAFYVTSAFALVIYTIVFVFKVIRGFGSKKSSGF